MKSLKTLIIALAATAAFSTVASAQTLSPRAEANKTQVASGKTEDRARTSALGSPRSLSNQTKLAQKSEHEGDTLAAVRSSRLSPRAQQQLGETEFQVAPLAKKTCESACCKK